MMPNNQSNNNELIDLKKIFQTYFKHWKWIVASTILFAALGLVYCKVVKPTYSIHANMLIKDEDNSSLSSAVTSSFAANLGFGTSSVDDELSIVSSHSLIRSMIKELGLQSTYKENKFPFPVNHYKTSPILITSSDNYLDTLTSFVSLSLRLDKEGRGSVKLKSDKKKYGPYTVSALPQEIQTPIGTFLISPTSFYKKDKSLKMEIGISSADGAAEELTKNISIGLISKKSNVISLSIEDKSIARGKDILNTLMQKYNEDAIDSKNEQAINTSNFIQERLEIISEELSQAEAAVESYKKDNNLSDIETEVKLLLEKNADFKEKLIETETQLSIVNLIDDYVAKAENRHALIPAFVGITDKNLGLAIEEYNKVLLERTKLLQSTHESNPMIQTANEQIDLMRKNVMVSINNAKKSIQIARKELKGQEDIFLSRVKDAPTQEREFVDIKRNQELKEQLFLFLIKKREETALQLAITASKAKIVDQAYHLSIPIAPKTKIIFAGAGMLGFILSILVIYVIDLFDIRIKDKKSLASLTSLPVLGEIYHNRHTANIVVKDGVSTSNAELFRLLRTNLMFYLTSPNDKVVLVTSTVSGEGKSFISTNLAASLALLNKKVVILGLDIRNPKLAEYFSMTSTKQGVTQYLGSSSLAVEEIINPSSVSDNLDVILAGVFPPNPAELLMRDRLDTLFAELRTRYDYIIIDSAPIGMVSDTFSLNRVCDASIYVCRANYSKKEYMQIAKEAVDNGKLKNLSIVINDTVPVKGYGYGYGSDSFKR